MLEKVYRLYMLRRSDGEVVSGKTDSSVESKNGWKLLEQHTVY